LFGFRGSDGKAFFIEVKNEIGKLRQEQRNFQQAMEITPAICGVARSVEEALKIVEGL
ncbi:VRR-NUC domain-containing protein, partial [Listeria monocytogenes]|uniref:VRR-NUC domain-containing protein n=1 Tax=Listeria monocytogenes TaxID=1639 RepID=UPI0035CC6FFA